jgi:hypothetical protein
MGSSAALNLREVGLADGRSGLAIAGFVGFLDGSNQFQLSHGPAESPEIAFDFAKITNFVAQLHILQIAITISQFAIKASGAEIN